MPDRINISELHGYLLDERKNGSLTEIPATLYAEVYAELFDLARAARKMGDPFGEGVQILLKERESLREYIRDLYAERTRKIFSLALAKSTGEKVNREDLRAMVPGERSLYEVIADSATACRKALLDGKQIVDTTPALHFTPSETEHLDDVAPFADAHADEVFQSGHADTETASESYRVIMIQKKVEEFQDYSGRCYALSPGDIVSLPRPMAEILCNCNIALNIRFRK
ncbi:MAG TPA: DNA replication complex GINS family protein [Methanocorpusculum sp.]|nr:DNA replication complex GINS family protein [Methanocorpusculum sp.]